jgi:type I restriction enzyme, S subunit
MGVKSGYKQTEVGVIPEDWAVMSIGQIARIKTGPFGTLLKASEYSSEGVPVVSVGEIRQGYLRVSDNTPRVSEVVTKRLPQYVLKTGDIVFGRKGGVDRSAHIRKEEDGWFLGSDGIAIRADEVHQPEFLAFQFQTSTVKNWLLQNSTGTTMPSLNQGVLSRVQIPIPSAIQEQQAITEALSDADALVESLEQLLAKKRHIKQGAMQDLLTGKKRLPGFQSEAGYALTELGAIPKDWLVISASEACTKIQDGTHFSPRIGGNDYLYITSKNIRRGFLDFSTADRIDTTQHQAIYRRCDVRRGDILLTKDGANTGNAALNPLDEQFSLLSSVAFLRPYPDQYSAPYFLQQILSSQGQHQIQDAMSGNAITRLTLGKINRLRFPVPPTKDEQDSIAAVLSDIDAEIVTLETKLTKARQLKTGMMQELLTGRIRLI